MKKNVLIVHYNTPYLTECLVKSINKHVKDAFIYIFDNSDKEPFTAKFDNVTILDNTKGQIVNFIDALKKYSNSSKSAGKRNNYGSFKHCYSVQKAIEIIREPFVLLDSDVLIHRDFSELYDDKAIYSSEITIQPNSSIKRVLPFICFINSTLCLNNNVKYFDENYMHGLYKTPLADRYDTGSGFYLNAKKLKHNEIVCEKYIYHLKAGSWQNKAKISNKGKYSEVEFLKKYKHCYDNNTNMKKVVYTCITGSYDKLLDPLFYNPDFDYVCFTDNNKLTSNIWDIRQLPKETESLTQVKKQRYTKVNPHKVLPEYELSIWVDANIDILGDLNAFINEHCNNQTANVYIPSHPKRKCIYSEASAVKALKKDSNSIVDSQMARYRDEGFPSNYGLPQSGIILRRHNQEDCKKLMNAWWEEINKGSQRDQLSFSYALWKNSDVNVKYIYSGIFNSKWFYWCGKHGALANRKTKLLQTNHSNTNSKKANLNTRNRCNLLFSW